MGQHLARMVPTSMASPSKVSTDCRTSLGMSSRGDTKLSYILPWDLACIMVVPRVICSLWGDIKLLPRLFYKLPWHLACMMVVPRVISSFWGDIKYFPRLLYNLP